MTTKTVESCPECRCPDATCEHGIIDEFNSPLHKWSCPVCGESYAIFCYECSDCLSDETEEARQ